MVWFQNDLFKVRIRPDPWDFNKVMLFWNCTGSYETLHPTQQLKYRYLKAVMWIRITWITPYFGVDPTFYSDADLHPT